MKDFCETKGNKIRRIIIVRMGKLIRKKFWTPPMRKSVMSGPRYICDPYVILEVMTVL